MPKGTQDSPKVPEGLPTSIWRMWIGSTCGEWRVGDLPEHPAANDRIEIVEVIPLSALLSDEVVEAVARHRWNARREAIIQSGSAEGPGAAWDDIEPDPRNGHDVRASEWNAARDFAADLQAAIEQVGGKDHG